MRFPLFISLFLLSLTAKAQLAYTQPVFGYDSIMNISYGTAVDYAGNTDTLLMDIFKPHGDANCLRPVIVLVHGGSWVAGSKEDPDLVYLSRHLAERGWVVANINYRLGTHKAANYTMYALCNNTISAPCMYICDSSEIYRANYRGMQDTNGAIRFMKMRHLADSSDINNVFLAGESAGGFVCLATAFTDQQSEKPLDCFAITNAPTPDPDFVTYGCNPAVISYVRPDLGSIDGDLNTGTYDAKVKGIGNFFGGVMDPSIFNQQTDTPAVYLFHQGSDVVVDYIYNKLLGRINWECYAQSNICQQYYFYPHAYGSEGIRQYFVSLGGNAPNYQADIVSNYNYMNDCLANGHSIDNVQIRMQNMVNFFSPVITATGNNPVTNCQTMGLNEISQALTFSIFPNPSSGEINLQFGSPVSNVDVKIYSAVGKLVFENIYSGNSKSKLQITTSLQDGCYFITAETKGEIKTSTFVIIH
ncbi:hypothetical protein BH09BAC5_BH09BAC5_06530 [soil metagenome]